MVVSLREVTTKGKPPSVERPTRGCRPFPVVYRGSGLAEQPGPTDRSIRGTQKA
jgi:hypothetical protein